MFTTRFRDQLPGTYSKVMPTPLAEPYWVGWNQPLAEQMAIPLQPNDDLLQVFSGRALFSGHDPIAQKYAGHQFGGWNPELGDGRGLLLGDWHSPQGTVWELHLKGAGKTPYSRFGDGRAVLRSSIREFLGSEALHALGIASTRALGVIGSTESVYRETVEPGATLLRVTQSHIRFGHFEWFAFSKQPEQLRALTDYCIRHHFPDCANHEEPVLAFFADVMRRTAQMIAGWMAYGFVHGVMNTDNMSILGETFDYGPYAFLDRTALQAVFNHTDQGGRYAFDQQPSVGLWNLQRLGQALAPLADVRALATVLQDYHQTYQSHFYRLMNQRLGGSASAPIAPELIDEWQALLSAEQKDYHLWYRRLASLDEAGWFALADEFIDRGRYLRWCEQITDQFDSEETLRQQQMLAVNPATVARSHHLQRVIDAAHQGDFEPFNSLQAALQSPFTEQPQWQQWHLPPTEGGAPVSLSCSS